MLNHPKLNADKCNEVVLAALWLTGNISSWPESADSMPCENCMNVETLFRLHEAGMIEEPPLTDYRPVRLTPAGQQRALEAFQRLCCD